MLKCFFLLLLFWKMYHFSASLCAFFECPCHSWLKNVDAWYRGNVTMINLTFPLSPWWWRSCVLALIARSIKRGVFNCIRVCRVIAFNMSGHESRHLNHSCSINHT